MKAMSLQKIAETKWLKLFTRTYIDKKGFNRLWDFCSRKENPDKNTHNPDAVVVVQFLPDGRMVIIKQFRPAIKDYIYENIAGLVDDNDSDILDAASRELLEEVGLTMTTTNAHYNILYNSVGITDESCSYVFCQAEGELSTDLNEESEDIEIVAIHRYHANEIILNPRNKISAKCWLVLQAYANGFNWFEST